MNTKSLDNLPIGKTGEIITLLNTGRLRRRFLDLGITPHSTIRTERISPLGNPIAFHIKGTIIALRKEDAKNIIVNIL